jgi:PAS domain S-box-containing protein
MVWEIDRQKTASDRPTMINSHQNKSEQVFIEDVLRGQARILEMIATGCRLIDVLDAITRFTESQAPGIRCAVAFMDAESRLRPASGPTLPPEYSGPFDEVPIPPYLDPCGLAAYKKEEVVSENIDTDARWSDGFRSFTRTHGLRACWSRPVLDSQRSVIGTFAVYSVLPGAPEIRHRELMEIACRLSSIAIERQRREERLHLYGEIIGRSTEAIRILEPCGKIIEQNAAHRKMFGISDDALRGKTPAAIFGDEQFSRILNGLAETGRFEGELTATINGESHLMEVSTFSVKDRDGKVLCHVGVSRDVTEKRKGEDELKMSHALLESTVRIRTSQLHRLSARLLTAQDEERRRIARELHDSVGQYLAGIQMNLDAALRGNSAILGPVANRISDSAEMAQRCLSEVRTVSYLLHPPLLDEMGLASALAWYADGFAQRSGIRVELDIPKDLGRLATDIETALFRVVQQGLANVHSHSGSHVAKIRLARDAENVIAEICDEGRGISPEALDRLHSGTQLLGVGIAGMRGRVSDMGGRFDIRSGPDGTTIEVSLPISGNSEALSE